MPFAIEVEAGRFLRFKAWGPLIEPKSARWKAATPAQRKRYYPLFAEALDEAWGAQMLEGLGRRGKLKKPRPISRLAYVQAGLESTGPALLPRREGSRAYRHRRVTPYADLGRVTGYFGYGTGRWLSYHHEGVSGRGHHYFDDRGRIRWAGIRGQITGIHRDLMPTSATIAAAVAVAGREWAKLVGPAPAGAKAAAGGPAAPRPARPAPRPAAARSAIPAPPRAFASAAEAEAWSRANLRTPVEGMRIADLPIARAILASLARVEARLGGRLPVPVRFVDRVTGSETALAGAVSDRSEGPRRIELRAWLGGDSYPEDAARSNRRHREQTGRPEPWTVGEESNAAETLLWHELGHVIDDLGRDPNGSLGGRSFALRRLYYDDGEAGEEAMRGVSGYAATDWYGQRAAREAWAECWAAVVARTPQADRVPGEVRAMVESAYDELRARVRRGDFAPAAVAAPRRASPPPSSPRPEAPRP